MSRGMIFAALMLLAIAFGCTKTDTVIVYKEVDPLLDSAATITVGRVIERARV